MSNCKKKSCGCEDTGLTTPSPCIHDTPQCPDPEKCSEFFDTDCIIYNGDPIPCYDIDSGDTITDIITKITEKLSAIACEGSCVNPMEYLLQQVSDSTSNQLLYPSIFTGLLAQNPPIILPNLGTYCCPDCGCTPYILTGFDEYFIYRGSTSPPIPITCPLALGGSEDAVNTFISELGVAYPVASGTGFDNAFTLLSASISPSTSLEDGLLEQGSFGGSTTLNIINTFINTITSSSIRDAIIQIIQEAGIIIQCVNNQIIISSVNSWLEWTVTQPPCEPCCIGEQGPEGPAGPEGPGLTDSGWIDLLGFNFMPIKPQYRILGRTVVFRGSAVIPLAAAGSPTVLIPFTNEGSYVNQAQVTPYAGTGITGGVLVNTAGSITFNQNAPVVPSSAFPDNTYGNIMQTYAYRLINSTSGSGSEILYSTMVGLFFTNSGKLIVQSLYDIEERTGTGGLGASNSRFITTNVITGQYAMNFRTINSGSTIHGTTSFPGPSPFNIAISPTGAKHQVTMDAARAEHLGGFNIRLDGLVAYLPMI